MLDQETSQACSSEDEHSVATAVDANMASEESEADEASMKEEQWKENRLESSFDQKKFIKSPTKFFSLPKSPNPSTPPNNFCHFLFNLIPI